MTAQSDGSQAPIATGTEMPASPPTTTTQLPTTISAPIPSADEAGEPRTTETAPATTTPPNVSDDAADSSADAEDAPEERDVPRYPREPRFGTHRALEWPFSGLIQLWYDSNWSSESHWYLRYWHWPATGTVDSAVRLPGFDTDCRGVCCADNVAQSAQHRVSMHSWPKRRTLCSILAFAQPPNGALANEASACPPTYAT